MASIRTPVYVVKMIERYSGACGKLFCKSAFAGPATADDDDSFVFKHYR